MATPKKKISRSRRNMRRFASGNRMDKTTIVTCPSCNDLKRPHRICDCGFYDAKAVLPSKKATTEVQA